MKKTNQTVNQQKVQKPASVMAWGFICAHGMGDLKKCDGAIDAEAYVRVLERHMLSQELHVYFSRTMLGRILHKLQHHGFMGIECMCLTGLPTVWICLLLKM